MTLFRRIQRRSRYRPRLFPWWIIDWKSWLAGLLVIAGMTVILIGLSIFQDRSADDIRAQARDMLWSVGH